ncbi:hypothetical protein QTP70_012250 [Hemibagrus guttatus]|uniref:Uncharacterized protein n=1 Tax=Hemibagrus guttatus TaxID=175788 RepID=A0AAE0Q7W9_9TELE|nr:hypothetical protein QTP70_012250 [Hemibagrus guttatus]
MERCGGYGTVWRLWNGVEDMEWCGGYGMVWRLWNGVEDMERCGGYGTLWRLWNDVEDKEWCGGYGTVWRIRNDVEDKEWCGGYGMMWRIRNGVENMEQCGGYGTVWRLWKATLMHYTDKQFANESLAARIKRQNELLTSISLEREYVFNQLFNSSGFSSSSHRVSFMLHPALSSLSQTFLFLALVIPTALHDEEIPARRDVEHNRFFIQS